MPGWRTPLAFSMALTSAPVTKPVSAVGVGALQHRHRLLARECRDQLGLREGLQQLDRDDANLLALAAQILDDLANVVGDGAEAHHHRLGVLARIGHDGAVGASRQRAVFGHCLAHETRDVDNEVRAVVCGACLEIGLVLHAAGEAGVVRIDEGRNALARALLIGVEPLAAPCVAQSFGDKGQGLRDERAFVVALDRIGRLFEEALEVLQAGGVELGALTLKIPVELIDAALGAEQHLLRDRRGLDPALGIADELAQQLRLRHRGFAQHVARREAVHAVGDRDQRQHADLVGDGRKVGRFLRIAAEHNRVARRKQRIDVVMPGHHVQRMLGHHPRRDLKHEAADLLASGDVMRFKSVQDALAGGGIRNVFSAGQRRTERAALRRVFALRFEEEWMLTPDVHTAAGPESLINFGYFS